MTAPRVVWHWNPKQSEAILSDVRYLDLEGGIRAGKTTAPLAKIAADCVKYPGIKCFIGRWTQDALDGQLKPMWRDMAEKFGLHLKWHAGEDYFEVLGTGSIVYCRGLKAGEDVSRYTKIRGLTLARILIDQAEEMPYDFFRELQGRLSQYGYPQQMILTPQPVQIDHWIATEFRVANTKPDHRYIRTNVYDNAVNVGEPYIRTLEAAYPLGSSFRRTLLEGRRGLSVAGEPVYGGVFNRRRHVDDSVTMNPELPLYEAWDYGHHHPCVVWAQFLSVGRVQILGAVMGQDISLDQFAPVVLQYRNQWCPNPLEVVTTGDPAGLAASSQGLPTSVKQILADHGVFISAQPGANAPEIRDQAIKTLARYMTRTATDGGPAFLMHSRAMLIKSDGAESTEVLADGFEGGYVWDTRARIGPTSNIRRPKKDGTYDHGQNCCEYLALAFGAATWSEKDTERAQRAALKRLQKDDDPPRVTHSRRVGTGSRGSYRRA